ncbi:Phox-like protein [Microthyrium microscopicum]|uniref:Endosomal/vacuolar adapter protein YPT35 n=1 Tax=Microthyrium microscopicum TaxID=703497 RepID=A0A6A6USD4_9PEZI|nr:Phox-like protein [Microthyrium microscopicum]
MAESVRSDIHETDLSNETVSSPPYWQTEHHDSSGDGKTQSARHSGSTMSLHKRYSEFDTLRSHLSHTFPNSKQSLPKLPPKSALQKFQPKFLEKRREGLEYFLNCVICNPEFSASVIMKEFMFS